MCQPVSFRQGRSPIPAVAILQPLYRDVVSQHTHGLDYPQSTTRFDNGRRVTIRVRQRSRNSLRAFADPLAPAYEETAIDRLQVRVRGVCRSLQRGCSGRDYRALVATSHPDMDWAGTPQTGRGETKVATRKRIAATIGFRLVARDRDEQHVAITVDYDCNPTRTLAHLLHRFRTIDDIANAVSGIGPVAFFSEEPGVALSLDQQTNWVADPNLAHRAFGRDIFTAFLPLYVANLRALSSLLLTPDLHCLAVEEGADDVIRSDAYEVRLNWGEVSAPQAETYFERHHGSAQTVVRSAAQNVLTKLDHVTVRHHLYETGFARRGDLFSMRCRLPNERELSLYAKDTNRLRFEVSRKKAGRYHVPVQPGASGRLLSILTSEREILLTALQWRVAGELLAEHPVPVVGDLLSLITLTASACEESGSSLGATMAAFIADGGVSEIESNRALITLLVRSGVLERITLRRRDQGSPKRFALRGAYMAAFEAILDALSTSYGN